MCIYIYVLSVCEWVSDWLIEYMSVRVRACVCACLQRCVSEWFNINESACLCHIHVFWVVWVRACMQILKCNYINFQQMKDLYSILKLTHLYRLCACYKWTYPLTHYTYSQIMRFFALWPFGDFLHKVLMEFVDSKDSGQLILSHIYLLAGFSLPLWLYPLRVYTNGKNEKTWWSTYYIAVMHTGGCTWVFKLHLWW